MTSHTSTAREAVTYRLGELFCGPGGIAVGASQARNAYGDNIVHQWATDYDKDTCDTYAANIPGATPESVIHADVRTLDYQQLHALGDIDGLAFGFPCNDFSVVGEQKGFHGEFGPLYTYGVKALQEFQPAWFLAENVGGLRSANEGAAFKQIQADLRDAGYKLVTNLYRFEEYGVPQARHRIIIVGIRNDIDRTYRVPSTKPFESVDISARTALTVPPITPDMTGTELTRQSPTVVERLKLIKPGQNAFTADLPPHLQIKTATKISQIYKRLHPDLPAYTVTGSGGGGTHMYHWDEPRALTNRERARLQTFPDNFNFAGTKEQVRKQIGMAVPPRGAKVIFEAILNTMAEIDYPSQEPNME